MTGEIYLLFILHHPICHHFLQPNDILLSDFELKAQNDNLAKQHQVPMGDPHAECKH
jgi:hypothetical protein